MTYDTTGQLSVFCLTTHKHYRLINQQRILSRHYDTLLCMQEIINCLLSLRVSRNSVRAAAIWNNYSF